MGSVGFQPGLVSARHRNVCQPELNDLDTVYAVAQQHKTPLIRVSVTEKEVLSGRLLECFPTGVTLKYDAASIQDAARIMSVYRERRLTGHAGLSGTMPVNM